MQRFILIIVPCILVACAAPYPAPSASPTPAAGPVVTPVPALASTKTYLLTAESATMTASIPENDATITAILAAKSAGGTAIAGTMTALPSETPLPTLPADAPYCQPGGLRASYGSNAATQTILLSLGLANSGSQPCFLDAWPQEALLDRQGQPLDVDYGYFDMGLGSAGVAATQRAREYATARVGLWPGWIVWANLIWQNWCAASIPGGVIIQLTFSHAPGTIQVPTDVQSGGTCNAPGQRSYVGIARLVLMPSP
jgi:hypothetical protein